LTDIFFLLFFIDASFHFTEKVLDLGKTGVTGFEGFFSLFFYLFGASFSHLAQFFSIL